MPEYKGGHCSECGAVVHPAQAATHNEWHEKMDELIQWVQTVDKRLFNPHPTDIVWQPGDPIE